MKKAPFSWGQLWTIEGYCPTKRLKIAEQVSLGVLQHLTKFQVKILRGKNL